ncbi:MAG: hypothetical protein Q4G65_18125 [bacterium]|nr:hypothetical protein [bacterium]
MACRAEGAVILHEDYVRKFVEPLYEREIFQYLRSLPRRDWSDDALALVKEEMHARARAIHRHPPAHYDCARKLVARGCDWPIVRIEALFADFWKVATQRDSEVAHRAMDVYQEVKRDEDVPPMLKMVMATIIREHGTRSFYYREAANALERFIRSREWGPDELRPLWDIISESGLGGDVSYLRMLVEVDCPVIREGWLHEMLEGKVDFRTAWAERGGGWAYTVTDEGWEKYNTYIERAKRHFEKAYKMRPDLPSSAAMMIDCSRGDAEQCRLWFDRAIAIEPDMANAYAAYQFTIRPRWGGSLEKLAAFAEECFVRGRQYPSMALRAPIAVYTLSEELEKDWEKAFDIERVYTNMLAMTRLFRNQDFHPDILRRDASHLMLAPAYVRGDLDTLAACAIEDFGGWDRKATDPLYCTKLPFAANIKNISLAFAGGGREELVAAERVKRAGRLEEAKDLFRRFYRTRLGTTNETTEVLGMEYAAGEVVRLDYRLFESGTSGYSVMPEVLKKFTRWSFWRCWDESWTVETNGCWAIRNRLGSLESTWPIIPDNCRLTMVLEKVTPEWNSGFGVLLDGWTSPALIVDLLATGNTVQWSKIQRPYTYNTMKREGELVRGAPAGKSSFSLSFKFRDGRTEVFVDGVALSALARGNDDIVGPKFPIVFGQNIRIKEMRVEKDQ